MKRRNRLAIMVMAMLFGLLVSPVTMADDAQVNPQKDAQVVVKLEPATAPAAALAPETKPTDPKDAKDALNMAGEAVKAGKEGNWWYMSSLLCLLIMFVLKMIGVLEKIGRWKYVILPVLSLAAALLAAFQGGVNLETAFNVFTSSWATGMLEELWSHGIRGKPHT